MAIGSPVTTTTVNNLLTSYAVSLRNICQNIGSVLSGVADIIAQPVIKFFVPSAVIQGAGSTWKSTDRGEVSRWR